MPLASQSVDRLRRWTHRYCPSIVQVPGVQLAPDLFPLIPRQDLVFALAHQLPALSSPISEVVYALLHLDLAPDARATLRRRRAVTREDRALTHKAYMLVTQRFRHHLVIP